MAISIIIHFEKFFKDSVSYRRLDPEIVNPSHFIFDGIEFYVYIKNLSPAYFSNRDIWRAQMTGIEKLNEIKASPALFVLLGYDDKNDVYAVWDPYQIKQRIGTANSPSLYSRLSLQREVSKTKEIKMMTLNNDQEVLVFPHERLVDVFSNIELYFPESPEYVAIGSKRRKDANEAYKVFINTRNLDDYAKSLIASGNMKFDVEDKCIKVKKLLKSSLISSHRKIFLAHNSLSEYKEAVDSFFTLEEVKYYCRPDYMGYYKALNSYVRFLQKQNGLFDTDTKGSLVKEDLRGVERHTDGRSDNINEGNVNSFNEKEYEDENGNLTKIANPELLEQIRPYLDTEYPSLPPVYNIISEFYGDRYPNMQFKDWGKLISAIDWSKQNEAGIVVEEKLPSKKKTQIIRVEFSDGRIIEDKNVSTTYCEFIKNIGAEEISILNIRHAGVNIVSKELNSKYASYQRDIGGGWYVLTNSTTLLKFHHINEIIKEYGLDTKVSLVPLNSSFYDNSSIIPHVQSGKREKIRVQFPNGRIIQPSKVLEALVEVVKYAGAERVHSLHINNCGYNLIIKIPPTKYKDACKPVGKGWLCNTRSDTHRKYDQINYISEKLKLGLNVDLISESENEVLDEKAIDSSAESKSYLSVLTPESEKGKKDVVYSKTSDDNTTSTNIKIENQSNNCKLLDNKGNIIFSSNGKLIMIGDNIYRVYYTYSSISINLVIKNFLGNYVLGERIIHAQYRSPLYTNLDVYSYLDQIKRFDFNKETNEYYVKVNKKWFNKNGDYVSQESTKKIMPSSEENKSEQTIQNEQTTSSTKSLKLIELRKGLLAVIGNTDPYKEELKALGGCFTYLPKWGMTCVFSQKLRQKIETYINGNTSFPSSTKDNPDVQYKKNNKSATKNDDEINDKRIGYIVKLYPSQSKGKIISVKKGSWTSKKLVVKTNSGKIVEIDDLPFLYEVLKKK